MIDNSRYFTISSAAKANTAPIIKVTEKDMEVKSPAMIDPKQLDAATIEPTIPITQPCEFFPTEFENSVIAER